MFKFNNTIRSEFDINFETEKCTYFLISLSRLQTTRKAPAQFARWLSITNLMAMQTQDRVAICT